jgi:alpha-1,6-mannosyltransferase
MLTRPVGYFGRIWSTRPVHPFRDLHLAGAAGLVLYPAAANFFAGFPLAGIAARELFHWVLILGLLTAFAAGYRAIRLLPESPRLRRVVAGYAVALTITAALTPAFHSDDLYLYINTGWQQAGYGMNPYRVLLYETPNGLTDPMFCQVWQFLPCTYGCLFALEARVACEISGHDHATAVLTLKALAAACFLLLGLAAWYGGRAIGRSAPIRGAFLVLWNPLLLLHGVSNAHNDLQLALGVAIALLAFLRGRWLVVFPALAAAALVKYLSIVAVPFFLLASIRRFGWRRTGASCAASLALVAACCWPYRDGFDATYFARVSDNLSSIHNSLASIAVFPYEVLAKPTKPPTPDQQLLYLGVKLAGWSAFAAYTGMLFLGRLRRPASPADLVRDCVAVLLAVILASPKYHAWYLGMVLPLAVWLPRSSRLRHAVLALGVANLLSFTFVYQAHLANALLLLVAPLGVVLRSARAYRDPDTPAYSSASSARPASTSSTVDFITSRSSTVA